MITQIESDKLKKIIGTRPGVKLQAFFKLKKIHNRYGDVYSTSMITRVLSGKIANPTVEKGILDMVEKLLLEREVEELRKKKLLSHV